MYNLSFTTSVPVQVGLDSAFYGGLGRNTREVWAKAEDHVLKIEKEYVI
jgi:hypothetical protein